MLVFIIVLLLWLSISVGIAIEEKLGLCLNWYKSPLGFFLILGGYQIITFPLMTLRGNLSILYAVTIVYLTMLLVFSIFRGLKVVQYINEIFKTKEFFFCLCVSVILILIYSRFNVLSTLSDFNFYIPLVGTNNHGGWINNYDPWNGIQNSLSWMYNFQSYYLLLSSISYLFNIEELLLVLWVPTTIFFILFPLIVFDIIKMMGLDKIKINKYIVFLIISFLSQLNLFFIEFAYYGNNFRTYVFLYLLMLIEMFFKTGNRKLNYLVIVLGFAHISFQSTALFISIMLLIVILIYDEWKTKSYNIKFSFLFTIPIFCYGFAIIFIQNRLIALLLTAIYISSRLLLSQLLKRDYKNFISSAIRMVLVCIILCIYSISIFMEIRNGGLLMYFKDFIRIVLGYFSTESNRSVVDYLQLLLFGSGITTFIYYTWKKRHQTFLTLLPLITIILFFNPLVFAFVSDYLTGIVYDRTLIMIYSMITIAIIIYFINELRWGRYIFYCMLLLSTGIFLDTLNQERFNDKLFKKADEVTYDLSTKLPKDLVDITQFLENYVDYYYAEPYLPSILSSDLRIRLIYNQNYLKFTVSDYRYSTILDEDNENYWLTYLYKLISESGNSYFISADLSHIQDIIKSYPIEYIITPSHISVNLEETLSSFCRWIYGNTSYRLYQVIL